MEHKEFRKAAHNMQIWANELQATVEPMLRHAQQSIENPSGKSPDDMPEQCAELCIRDIRKRIYDVMTSYDSLLESLGFRPEFKVYFDLTELTVEGWQEMQAVLREHKELAS